MKMNKKRLAAVLILSQLLFACGILPKEEQFQSAPIIREYEGADFGKTKVMKGDMIDSVNVKVKYLGTAINEMKHPDYRKVERVYVELGSKVKKGDILVRYYVDEAVSQYDEADYNFKVAQTKIRHQKELLKTELEKLEKVGARKKEIQAIREEYQANIKQIESSLKIYRLEKQEAEDQIKAYDLKAQISGTVTYIEPEMEGKLASSGEVALTIEGEKKNYFEAITEHAKYFKDGETVNVEILKNTYPVSVKKNTQNSKKVTFHFRNKVTNISSGGFGTVVCILNQKKDVLYLPSSVIYRMEGKDIVYIEDENGLKMAVEVKKGVKFNNLTQIVSGLKEGDEVITN